MECKESTVSSIPNHPAPLYTEGVMLGAEISKLSAYIYAATYRLLLLIREFDEKNYWHHPGLCSCAHWLNFQCGIGMNAAREKVRVAHALKDLPLISAGFEKGELSYSKVRAMTRIANADNEEKLMSVAKHGTAHHVEKLVSLYRGCVRRQDRQNANIQHLNRAVSIHYDDDGSMIIHGRFAPEQGALIVKALEMAMTAPQETIATGESPLRGEGPGTPEVTAVTPDPEPVAEPFKARRADALVQMAESYLNNAPAASSTADRYQVVVHVSAVTLKSDVTAETSAHINGDLSHLQDGPHVTAETSRRIACDCSIVGIVEDEEGEPLSVGRKTRSIPPALQRALRSRDQGCRFPGCTSTHFIDGHHIKHWADGGETSMTNLVQLCRHHHRLVHEGGFDCKRLDDGQIEFRDPRGGNLPSSPFFTSADEGHLIEGWIKDWMPEIQIDEQTCVAKWYAGDTMDWDIAVGNLFH
jgi:uncharacterized protein DUF222/HNH endonuclease